MQSLRNRLKGTVSAPYRQVYLESPPTEYVYRTENAVNPTVIIICNSITMRVRLVAGYTDTNNKWLSSSHGPCKLR